MANPIIPNKLDTRLKEVHQTDLTEGRINQDFLDWLKTKGMTYLLVALLVLCAYLVWVRWDNSRENYRASAWRELSQAALPTSLEEVAEKYGDVGAVASLARLNAASELLRAVQLGKTLGADEATRTDLTPEQRSEYLDRADRLYSEMLANDDQSTGKTLVMVTALTGRAVVAESKGELDKAREHYTQAASRAEKTYPDLAAQSRARAEAVSDGLPDVTLPTMAEVNAQTPLPAAGATPTPINVEPWIRSLMDGEAAGSETDATAANSGIDPG